MTAFIIGLVLAAYAVYTHKPDAMSYLILAYVWLLQSKLDKMERRANDFYHDPFGEKARAKEEREARRRIVLPGDDGQESGE